MASLRTVYVDPDVVGGAGDGTSWANAYSSMNAAENAENGNIGAGGGGSDEYVEFHCHSTSNSADTGGQVYFFGWTTDVANYIKWVCPTSDPTYGDCRHNGTYDTTKYRLEVVDEDACWIREEYVRLEGVQLYCTQDAHYDDPINISGVGTGDIWISHSIIKCSADATYSQYGMYINDTSPNYKIWNNLIFNCHAVRTMSCITVSVASAWIYNNTCIGGRYAVTQSSGTVYLKNNIGQSHNNGDYTGTFDSSSGRNIGEYNQANLCFGTAVDSGNTDGIGGGTNELKDSGQNFQTTCRVGFVVKNTTDTTYSYITAVVSDTELTLNDDIMDDSEDYEIYPNLYGSVTFDDEGSDNFHLGSGDTLAAANGYDLDTDGNCPVTDDVDGDTRDSSTPDIGFDEIGGPTVYQEFNRTAAATGVITKADTQQGVEPNKTIQVTGAITESDVAQMPEQVIVAATAVLSESDVLILTEPLLSIVASVVVSESDTLQGVESNKTVQADVVVTETDIATFADSVSVAATFVISCTDALGGQIYEEFNRAVEATGVVNGVDVWGMVELSKTVSFDGVISETDILGMVDTLTIQATAVTTETDILGMVDSLTVQATVVISETDVLGMIDTPTVQAAAVVTETDIAAFIDTDLTVQATFELSCIDTVTGTYLELDRTVQATGVITESNILQGVELSKIVEANGVASEVDVFQGVELNKIVEATVVITETDVRVLTEALSVEASGLCSVVDNSILVESAIVEADGVVICTDTLPGVFVVAAYVVLRQVTD
jgi:hypothetical protein